ncbi:MAG: zinc ribbon domain-containing protein [Nitrososphaerota archaeon]|nr:zinc ribbon domain-containing protein [Nitrososphaerota archaeon]MDG6919580.1 zinc ribbon domain-containing protein [Nitrososphaerota archaeon]MDG6946805.1 zinc ribbon domain-containing protein [Nitrososphaerota archaeon]MDG6948099.1 zinc ribbon domain-containing protein [Nitrososphaerota archaeon]
MMFCTSCGGRVEDGAAFCTKCGRPLRRDSSVIGYPSLTTSATGPVHGEHGATGAMGWCSASSKWRVRHKVLVCRPRNRSNGHREW